MKKMILKKACSHKTINSIENLSHKGTPDSKKHLSDYFLQYFENKTKSKTGYSTNYAQI